MLLIYSNYQTSNTTTLIIEYILLANGISLIYCPLQLLDIGTQNMLLVQKLKIFM